MSIFKKVFHNAVIRSMVAIEFFFAAAFGTIGPVFAIFAADVIEGGSAKVVGFATAIFWITKALVQLPVARFIDKVRGERDDFWVYFLGQILWAIGVFLYVFAKTPMHIYLIQIVLGFALAVNIPALYGVFSRHLDRSYESFEWSLYSVFSYSIATAIAGALSGIIVTAFGFNTLFIISAAVFLLSAFLTFFLLKPRIAPTSIRPRRPINIIPEHHRHPGAK